jgi:hypothetical protein
LKMCFVNHPGRWYSVAIGSYCEQSDSARTAASSPA